MGQSLKTILWELAEKVGGELGYEVVEVSLAREGSKRLLRVFIDHPEGIGVEDCTDFSRRFSALLDEEDPIPTSYLLEVSSPGIERPLTKPEHFQRFNGEGVELRLYSPYLGRRKFKGRIAGWSDSEDGEVVLEMDGEQVSIPWPLIAKARLSYLD